MIEGLAQGGGQLFSVLDTQAQNACAQGNTGEVGFMQISAVRHVAAGFHFHVDKAQRAVVEHHHLDGQVQLTDAQQVPQQHGQAAVATQGYNLTIRMFSLGS